MFLLYCTVVPLSWPPYILVMIGNTHLKFRSITPQDILSQSVQFLCNLAYLSLFPSLKWLTGTLPLRPFLMSRWIRYSSEMAVSLRSCVRHFFSSKRHDFHIPFMFFWAIASFQLIAFRNHLVGAKLLIYICHTVYYLWHFIYIQLKKKKDQMMWFFEKERWLFYPWNI